MRAEESGGIGADERVFEVVYSGWEKEKSACVDGVGNGLLDDFGVVFPVIGNGEIGGFCDVDDSIFRKDAFRHGVCGGGTGKDGKKEQMEFCVHSRMIAERACLGEWRAVPGELGRRG